MENNAVIYVSKVTIFQILWDKTIIISLLFTNFVKVRNYVSSFYHTVKLAVFFEKKNVYPLK